MKQLIIVLLLSSFFNLNSFSQGCVAIRSTGVMCTFSPGTNNADVTKWMFNINNRYFRSFRHFVGNDEQKQRIALGTQVINYSYTADLAIQHIIDRRWSVALNMPVISNVRSSLYEHDGKHRHNTKSFGLGDARITAYRWMTDRSQNKKFNMQLGLGLKLPTGDFRYHDKFYSSDTTKIFGPVDQSIQLGDGGTGITIEWNGFYKISQQFQAYGNFYYLVNPREQNGVSTARGKMPTAANIANGSNIMSVPDQYLLRAGINYKLKKIIFSAGWRHECLPAHDLVGGSNGFRRPGFVSSVEPGITYTSGKIDFYANMPVAVMRNRMQSVPDRIRSKLTGIFTKGDAAFSDRTINIGCAIKF